MGLVATLFRRFCSLFSGSSKSRKYARKISRWLCVWVCVAGTWHGLDVVPHRAWVHNCSTFVREFSRDRHNRFVAIRSADVLKTNCSHFGRSTAVFVSVWGCATGDTSNFNFSNSVRRHCVDWWADNCNLVRFTNCGINFRIFRQAAISTTRRDRFSGFDRYPNICNDL